MGVMDRIERLSRALGPEGRFDPVNRIHFLEAISWTDSDEWRAIAQAYHSRDDAEFGRLLAQATHRYWQREACHEVV